MGQSASGGRQDAKQERGEAHELGPEDKITLHKVEVVRQREVIKVPQLVIEEEQTTRYIPHDEDTVRYVRHDQDTTKYNTREVETVKYVPREEETVKYVTNEVACEKPVIVEKLYEKPVLQEKEYTLVTYNDIAAIRELMELAPKLLSQLREIRDYKVIEEVIKVPKIQYVPTTIKKVKSTGELIDDAD